VAAGAARCRRCGTPLRITPETIIAVCSQCGFPNWINQAFIHPLEIVPAKTREVVESFWKYAHSDPYLARLIGKIAVKSVEIMYVPVYLARVEASAQYEGIATVTLVKRVSGNTEKGAGTTRSTTLGQRETRYVTVRVRGSVAREYVLPLPAIRVSDARTIEPLIDRLLETRPPAKPLADIDWEEVKGSVLPVEVTPQDAMVWARDEACERLYREVENIMQKEAEQKAVAVSPGWKPYLVVWTRKRAPCKAENLGLSPLTLVPLVAVYYTYNDSVYKVVLAGWDGSIILWRRPFVLRANRIPLAGAVLVSGLLGGAGAAFTAVGDFVSGPLLLLAGTSGAVALARRALEHRFDGKGG